MPAPGLLRTLASDDRCTNKFPAQREGTIRGTPPDSLTGRTSARLRCKGSSPAVGYGDTTGFQKAGASTALDRRIGSSEGLPGRQSGRRRDSNPAVTRRIPSPATHRACALSFISKKTKQRIILYREPALQAGVQAERQQLRQARVQNLLLCGRDIVIGAA